MQLVRLDLAIQSQRDIQQSLQAFCIRLLCFHGAVPIPYVQVAILNLLHPYLRSTIVLLDNDIHVCLITTIWTLQ